MVFGAGCRDRDVRVPEAPSVDALVSRYGEPTAVLDAASAQTVQATTVPDVATWSSVAGLSVIPDALVALERDLEADGETPPPPLLDDPLGATDPPSLDAGAGPPDPLPGTGVLRVEVRCPGVPDDPGAVTRLGDAPIEGSEGGGGRIELVATLRGLRVQSVVWGRFEDCRFQDRVLGEAVPIRLDGVVTFYLGSEGLDFRDVRFPDVLIEIGLDRFEVGDLAVRPNFDFRLRRTGALEARVDVGGGAHVFLVIDSGGAVLGVRDALSEWLCDFDAGVCTAPGREDLVF